MQCDTAHELDVEGNHIPRLLLTANLEGLAALTAAGIFHHGECFAHDIIKGFAVGKTLFEFRCFRLKFFIRKFLILLLKRIYPGDQRLHLFNVALAFGTEYGFDYRIDHCINIPFRVKITLFLYAPKDEGCFFHHSPCCRCLIFYISPASVPQNHSEIFTRKPEDSTARPTSENRSFSPPHPKKSSY